MGFALCETVAALPLVDCVAAGRRAARSRPTRTSPTSCGTSTSTPASTSPTPGRSSARSTGTAPTEQPEAAVRPARVHERRQPARGPDRPQGPRAGDGARAARPQWEELEPEPPRGPHRRLLLLRRRAAATSSTRPGGPKILRHQDWFDPDDGAVRRRPRRRTRRSSGSAATAASRCPTSSGRYVDTRRRHARTATTRPRT